MRNSALNNLRLACVLCVAMSLGACATGVGRSEAPLTPAAAGTAADDLYAGQAPAQPEAEAVVNQLEQTVAASPRDPVAYLRLGVAYRHVERFDEAKRVFEQAESLSETPYVARNELGILLRTQGQFTQAEQVYLAILSEAPEFHDAHFNLGILYDMYLRRPLDAQKHYQAYMENAPEADERVEKWLVDLQRRHQIDASATAGVVND